LAVGIALTSHEVTLIFLGERWSALIPLIPLIALFGLFDSFGVNTFNVFMILVRIAATAYGTIEYGIIGAAWALLLTAIVNATLWQLQVGDLLHLRVPELLRILWRGTFAALIMCAAVWLVPDDIGARLGLYFWPLLLALLAKAALGAGAYIGSVLLFWRMAGMPPESAEVHLLRSASSALSRIGIAPLSRRVA
jgi:O-antigen/teichoic acid export membrane protein